MKIAAFSDCHWLYNEIKEFPKADILIFAGDWCGSGYYIQETLDFVNWFSKLPYKTKIVVPGNHDRLAEVNEQGVKDIFKQAGARLLIDEAMEYQGLSIYGSPWCPFFNNWAFMLPEEQLKWKFKYIPDNLDILITHTPPMGICDPTQYGSKELLKRVNKVKPKYHIFGHNHCGYGCNLHINTKFYNVSVCSDADIGHNYTYELINPITIIEIN